MKFKKLFKILIPIILIIIVVILAILLSKRSRIDTSMLKDKIIKSYPYVDFVEMSDTDVSSYFSIETSTLSNYIFMEENVEKDENKMNDYPRNLFIYISGKESKNAYDSIIGTINSILNYEENQEIVSLYKDAIIEYKSNVLYVIVGENKDKLKDFLDL